MGATINNVLAVRCSEPVATAVAATYTMLRPATVIDALVINDNAAVQTVQISNGLVAITAALGEATPATGCVTRIANAGAAGLVAASKNLVAGNVLTFTPSAALAYTAYVYLYPTPGATR